MTRTVNSRYVFCGKPPRGLGLGQLLSLYFSINRHWDPFPKQKGSCSCVFICIASLKAGKLKAINGRGLPWRPQWCQGVATSVECLSVLLFTVSVSLFPDRLMLVEVPQD